MGAVHFDSDIARFTGFTTCETAEKADTLHTEPLGKIGFVFAKTSQDIDAPRVGSFQANWGLLYQRGDASVFVRKGLDEVSRSTSIWFK